MTYEWRSSFWRSVAQCMGGALALILLTLVCFQLKLDLAPAGFAYLIVLAVFSLLGSLIESFLLSVLAVGLLNFFFAPPLFSLAVENPQDILALAAFFTTALIVTTLRKKLDRLRHESSVFKETLVNAIPAFVWSALPDGSRDFHSQRWLEFTGLSAEQANGDGWAAIVHPDDRATLLDKWRTAAKIGVPFEAEARGRNVSGEYRWFLLRAEPLRDEEGEIVRWYGSNIDIEDRKRATDALQESESQWREVFEHNPVMYFMIDPTGTVLSVNTSGAAQLGYAVHELVGDSVLKVFLENDRESVKKNVAACLQLLGQSHSWEIQKIRKDGSVLWVRENAKAVRWADDRLIILVACEDITERKHVEEALQQSEMYLAEAQKLSHTGSFGWRLATGEIVWSNETFRIFEFDATQKPTLDLVLQRTHPEDRALLGDFLQRVGRAGKDWEFEHRLQMADGSVKFLRVAAHATTTASGHLEFIGVVMDVTSAHRANEELHQARAQLARMSRVAALGELTASIAHEVNQPLTGIVSSASAGMEWLERDPADTEKAKRSVERIIRDANRAGEVIQRVRDLVKKAPSQKAWLDLNQTARETISLTRRDVEQNRISLTLRLSESLPLVWADRVEIQQVILNLIINAIEALSAVTDRPRELLISSTEDRSTQSVLLTVRDSGDGLEPERWEQVFEAFYTTKQEGMGMGLAVSRSIIRAHRGRMWAAPNEPRGAVFQFTLPIGQGDAL